MALFLAPWPRISNFPNDIVTRTNNNQYLSFSQGTFCHLTPPPTQLVLSFSSLLFQDPNPWWELFCVIPFYGPLFSTSKTNPDKAKNFHEWGKLQCLKFSKFFANIIVNKDMPKNKPESSLCIRKCFYLKGKQVPWNDGNKCMNIAWRLLWHLRH